MKIMIDHAVPLNNGDAALIFALGDALESLGHQITYSTFQLKKVRQRYPNKKWTSSILSKKWLNHLPGIRVLYYCLRILLSPIIKEQDLIMAAPGGYINSYYGFTNKLLVLSLYHRLLGKPIVMAPQSIGPLSPSDERVLKKYLPYFSKFLVRDAISYERMKTLTGTGNQVLRSYDAAFLCQPKGYQEKVPTKKVAISVREWAFDQRNPQLYQHLIRDIVEELVINGFNVVFVSTCQGDKEYVDDAVEAQKIYDGLPESLKPFVTVDSTLYTLDELKATLQEFDFVIGTRLHMCILSWLSGVPAFNISYEEKGRECYDYLGLGHYTIDYNEVAGSEGRITSFLTMSEAEKQSYFERIETVHQEMNHLLKRVLKELES